MFEEVDLVDDVDQVLRFGHAPEHPVHAKPQFPFTLAQLAVQQSIRFPQVPVGADRVHAVVTKKRQQGKTASPGLFKVEFGLHHKAGRIRALAGVNAGLRKRTAFQAHAPGEFRGRDLEFRVGFDGHNRRRQPDRRESREVTSGRAPHHRARFKPVLLKSRFLSLVRN